MRYLVIIEKTPKSYGAHVPDLPGCVAVARTRAEVRKLIREAIDLHLIDLRKRGQRVPRPAMSTDVVEAKRARRGRAA